MKNTISTEKYSFEIVESIPEGFKIWNIPPMYNFLPLFEDSKEDKNLVNVDTLKAIYIADKENLQILRDCASYGIRNLKACKAALKKENPKTIIAKRKKELAEKAISLFEELF